MDEAKIWIGIIVGIAGAMIGSYVLIRVAIAKLEKDNSHLGDKINERNEDMREIKNDLKALCTSMNQIQIDIAYGKGRDKTLESVKGALETIAKKVG